MQEELEGGEGWACEPLGWPGQAFGLGLMGRTTPSRQPGASCWGKKVPTSPLDAYLFVMSSPSGRIQPFQGTGGVASTFAMESPVLKTSLIRAYPSERSIRIRLKLLLGRYLNYLLLYLLYFLLKS